MNSFPQTIGSGAFLEPEHPRLLQRPLSLAERRVRWEVRAAQWRAREIAEIVFGGVAASSLIGIRSQGPLRGLLELEVPFECLDSHREREARFMAAAQADPVLARVPLVFVFAPGVA